MTATSYHSRKDRPINRGVSLTGSALTSLAMWALFLIGLAGLASKIFHH